MQGAAWSGAVRVSCFRSHIGATTLDQGLGKRDCSRRDWVKGLGAIIVGPSRQRAEVHLSAFGEPAGNPAGDDGPTFAAAIASLTGRGGIVTVAAVTYYLNRTVVVPDNVTLRLHGATIRCSRGSARSHFFTLAGHGAEIVGGLFLGTGQRRPTAAYSSGTYPGTGVFVTNGAVRVLIEDCRFEDFSSGPILAYHQTPSTLSASRLTVRRCIFRNVQTHTAHETNAIVNLHRCDDSLIEDSYAESYNWKGFYLGNCTRSRIVRCDTNGGADGLFDSSHHIVGDRAGIYCDNGIYDCDHRGTGAGFKLNTSLRAVVRRFRSVGAFGGVVQACQDFVLDGVETRNDPGLVGFGIAVSGLPGFKTSGMISNASYVLSGPGRPGNTALSFEGAAGGIFGPVHVVNPSARNAFWGVSLANDGHAKSISIVNPQLLDCQQYGIVAFAGSLSVRDGNIQMTSPAAEAALFVASDGTSGGKIDIDGVAFSGSTLRRNIQVGGGFGVNYELLRIQNCTFIGGTRPLELIVGNDTANTLSRLVIENNTGAEFSTGGLSLDLGRGSPTDAIVRNNRFTGRNRTPVMDIFLN